MDKVDLPLPIGVSAEQELKVEKLKSAQPAKPSSASFAELSEEYVLCTHAIILKYSGLTFDPLLQCYAEHNRSDSPLTYTISTPIFSGFNSLLDNTLYAIHKDFWPTVLYDLGTIGFTYDGAYCWTVPQKLPMLDYLALLKKSVLSTLPMAEIYAFALESSKGSIQLLPNKNPLIPLKLTVN